MNFIEYLDQIGINESTPGNEGILYQMLRAWTLPMDYRHLSCLVSGLPGVTETFNVLWYEYETELDRLSYEAS